MNKPYAIFDMDGTLVDSMGFWKRLAFEYLKPWGEKSVSRDSGTYQGYDDDRVSSTFYQRIWSFGNTGERGSGYEYHDG